MAKKVATNIKELITKAREYSRTEATTDIANYIARENRRELPYNRFTYLPYSAFFDVGSELVEDGLAEWRDLDIVLTDKGAAMFLDE